MTRPMTMAEKILARHAHLEEVEPGELVECDLDLVLANDITAPIAIREFRRIGVDHVFDPTRIALVPDHYTPNKDIKSASQSKVVRDFAHEQGIVSYFEVGRVGIEHALLPESGLVAPGELIIGADSHTCTYGALGAFSTGMGSTDVGVAFATGRAWFKVPESIRVKIDGELAPWVAAKDVILHVIGLLGVDGALYQSMEFCGSTCEGLSAEGRMTVSNMAIEAGAKAGLFSCDAVTRAYVEPRVSRSWTAADSDPEARYAFTLEIDARDIVPTVAQPSLPSNTCAAAQLSDVKVDQVVIGSCTNGRIEDMRVAASILEGHHVSPDVRCIVIPATPRVFWACMEEGLMQTFVDAGCAVSTPTCGPCLGGHMGVLAAGERALSTTNRNFVGRMGDPGSEVYLAGPAVAAATAIAGHIAVPEGKPPRDFTHATMRDDGQEPGVAPDRHEEARAGVRMEELCDRGGGTL